MERMVEVVSDSMWQSLQNFLFYSPCDERALIDQIAMGANHFFGGDTESFLIVAENGFSILVIFCVLVWDK